MKLFSIPSIEKWWNSFCPWDRKVMGIFLSNFIDSWNSTALITLQLASICSRMDGKQLPFIYWWTFPCLEKWWKSFCPWVGKVMEIFMSTIIDSWNSTALITLQLASIYSRMDGKQLPFTHRVTFPCLDWHFNLLLVSYCELRSSTRLSSIFLTSIQQRDTILLLFRPIFCFSALYLFIPTYVFGCLWSNFVKIMNNINKICQYCMC